MGKGTMMDFADIKKEYNSNFAAKRFILSTSAMPGHCQLLNAVGMYICYSLKNYETAKSVPNKWTGR